MHLQNAFILLHFSTFEWDMSSFYWIHRLIILHVIKARRIRNVFIIRRRWRLRFQNNSLHSSHCAQEYFMPYWLFVIWIESNITVVTFLYYNDTVYFSGIFDHVRICDIQISTNDSLIGHSFVSLGPVNHFWVLITSRTNASCVQQ